MLTFFRRIRKSLLATGAARKYILYATGEVLLVMVGILLALQVNNWNEKRKSEIKTEQDRIETIRAVYDDMLREETNLDFILEQLEMQYQSGTFVLDFQENPSKYEYNYDTLFPHVNSRLTVAIIVERSQNSFDGIKMAGGLSIIKNDSLSEMLNSFYTVFDRRIANFNEVPKEVRKEYRVLQSQTHNLENLVGFYEADDWRNYKPDFDNMKRMHEIDGSKNLLSSITISSIVNLQSFNELKIQAQSIISYMEENYRDILNVE